MNASTYRDILFRRGQDPFEKIDGDLKYEMEFRGDLDKGKVVWTNRECMDWHCYFKLRHSLYSIFMAPKAGAFTRAERLVVQILQIAFSAIWSLGLTLYLVSVHTAIISPKGLAFSTLGCLFKYLTNTGNILKSIMYCAPCQREKCHSCEITAHRIIFFWSIIVAYVLFQCVILTVQTGDIKEFLQMFIMTTLIDWFAFQMILLTAMFEWKYWREKRNDNGKLNELYVSYIDYELYFNKHVIDERKLSVPFQCRHSSVLSGKKKHETMSGWSTDEASTTDKLNCSV